MILRTGVLPGPVADLALEFALIKDHLINVCESDFVFLGNYIHDYLL
jgi:hypothetical protein